jgi:hypothetical protein
MECQSSKPAGKDHLGDHGVDGRVFKLSKKLRVWNGISWCRIGAKGGLL